MYFAQQDRKGAVIDERNYKIIALPKSEIGKKLDELREKDLAAH